MNYFEFVNKYQKVVVTEFNNSVDNCIKHPVVSVHLVTFNHVLYIQRAIDSILMQQTDFEFEVIIGDDDSTDGTRDICIDYAKRFPEKVKLFLHDRRNNIQVYNTPCLIFQYIYNSFHLRGTFIATLSGDDYWMDPLKLQKQYDFLVTHPDVSLCYHRFNVINESNNIILNEEMGVKYERISRSIRPLTSMFINFFKFDIPNQFAEVLAEDSFGNYLLSLIGGKKFLDNIQPAIYRSHSNSIWSSKSILFKSEIDVITVSKIKESFYSTVSKREKSSIQEILTMKLLRRAFFKSIYTKESHISIWKFFFKDCQDNNISIVTIIRTLFKNLYFEFYATASSSRYYFLRKWS